MSWSSIDYGDYWAHAHDWEQISFMALAPVYITTSEHYKKLPWLLEWKDYWDDHKIHHGNGCSDIDLDGYLISQNRVHDFKLFLNDYKKWLHTFGETISAEYMNKRIEGLGGKYFKPCSINELEAFVDKIVAVLEHDLNHHSVNMYQHDNS